MNPITLGIPSDAFVGVAFAAKRRCEAAWAEFHRVVDVDQYRLTIYVPDMVPSLREWRGTIDRFVVQFGGPRAVGQMVEEVAVQIDTERDVRRWSQCDP